MWKRNVSHRGEEGRGGRGNERKDPPKTFFLEFYNDLDKTRNAMVRNRVFFEIGEVIKGSPG